MNNSDKNKERGGGGWKRKLGIAAGVLGGALVAGGAYHAISKSTKSRASYDPGRIALMGFSNGTFSPDLMRGLLNQKKFSENSGRNRPSFNFSS
jgi:hypothetical protein